MGFHLQMTSPSHLQKALAVATGTSWHRCHPLGSSLRGPPSSLSIMFTSTLEATHPPLALSYEQQEKLICTLLGKSRLTLRLNPVCVGMAESEHRSSDPTERQAPQGCATPIVQIIATCKPRCGTMPIFSNRHCPATLEIDADLNKKVVQKP